MCGTVLHKLGVLPMGINTLLERDKGLETKDAHACSRGNVAVRRVGVERRGEIQDLDNLPG